MPKYRSIMGQIDSQARQILTLSGWVKKPDIIPKPSQLETILSLYPLARTINSIPKFSTVDYISAPAAVVSESMRRSSFKKFQPTARSAQLFQ